MQLPKSLSRMSDLAQGFRSEDWRDSLPLWVSAGLVLLLAWQLVQLLWTALSDGPAAAVPTPAGPTAPAGPPIDLQGIVNAHLFGIAPVPGASELDPSAAPATQMSLVLVGTIAQSDPAKGFAIIGESAPTAKLFAVGKTVTGGTRLHSVYADRVILDRGGKLEALMLPKKFEGGGVGAPRGAVGSTAFRASEPMLGDQIRTLATQNPGAITEILRPQPVFANGQQRGYRVYPGRNRQQFSRLGLMPGDLVTAINGTPLDDPARGMEILQSINSASEVTVTIERNGQSSQVSINNAQVAADAAAAAAAAEQAESMPVEELDTETDPDVDETTE